MNNENTNELHLRSLEFSVAGEDRLESVQGESSLMYCKTGLLFPKIQIYYEILQNKINGSVAVKITYSSCHDILQNRNSAKITSREITVVYNMDESLLR